MAAQSRSAFDRPGAGLDSRRQMFWMVAGLIVVGLALLIVFRPGGGSDENSDEASSLPAPPPPAAPTDLVTETPPAAEQAATKFADGYVRFSYGLAEPSEIQGATPALVAKLERQDPRVPPTVQAEAGNVHAGGMEFSPISPTLVEATATIEGGDVSYQLAFELRKNGQRWLVSSVSAD